LERVKPGDQKNEACFVGRCLLKELVFKFVTYVCEEVNCKSLARILVKEYVLILASLVDAVQLSE
jgi:hypothetical protein